MWAYIKDGAIKQVNSVQTRLEINPGSYFPAKYANEWTKDCLLYTSDAADD